MKCTTPSNTRSEILVPLSVADLRRIIGDISSELDSDAIFADNVDSNNPWEVLKAWREFSPGYVEYKRRFHALMASQGKADLLFSPRAAKEDREVHDESADLLAKLLGYLPDKVTLAFEHNGEEVLLADVSRHTWEKFKAVAQAKGRDTDEYLGEILARGLAEVRSQGEKEVSHA